MDRLRGRIALIICFGMLLTSLLSAVFIAEHASHDCHGGHCEICAVISHFGKILKQLSGAAAAVSVALAAVCCLVALISVRTFSVQETPVSLRVQMNN